MDFHRIILLFLAVAGAIGSPQRPRQSSLSSPLSMGMRFIDNIRSGMTRTIGRIFGNGPQQGKEVNQIRPVRQHLPPPPSVPPPPADPPAHVHNIGTDAPSSFFTVVHDSGHSTPFPDIHGFTDESFKPNDFFTANSPFQGNVEEEDLSFQNEVNGPQVSGGSGPPGPSFAVFQEGQSFPAQGEVFHSSFPEHPAFDNVETSIPFGNTNHFNLGQSFRQEPSQVSVTPRPIFSEDLQVREDQKHGSRPAKPQAVSHQNVFLTSRADRHHEKAKPFTVQKEKSSSPIPSPSKSTTQIQFSSSSSTEPPRVYTTFQVIQDDKPLTHASSASTAFTTVTKEPLSGDTRRAHAKTGTKLSISPKSDGNVEETEVNSYEFGYGVLDDDSGNQYFHAEKREEGLTKGSYKIQLADGRVQTVTYVADNKGFHPQITYEGEARYPEDKDQEDT